MAEAHRLARAIGEMLPDAQIAVVHQHDWHSMTFTGKQICLTVLLASDDAWERLQKFAEALPEHVFSLPKQIVADIAAEPMSRDGNVVMLQIEALVLDD